MPPEYGGLGLNMVEQSSVFEEAGTSLLGPLAQAFPLPFAFGSG